MPGAWRVGLLVVVFAALVVAVLSFLGVNLWRSSAKTYYAELQDAGGLRSGARVLMTGVQIGTVSSIDLKDAKTARFTLSIDAKVKLPKGTAVLIPSSFIGLGDTPLNLLPGTDEGFIDPENLDAPIPGRKATALETVMPEAIELIEEVQATLVQTQKTLVEVAQMAINQERLAKVDALLDESTNTIKQFGSVANRVDQTIAGNQATMESALRSAVRSVKNVEKITATFAKLVESGKLTDQAEGLLAEVTTTTRKAGELVDSLQSFVNDPELREPLAKTAKNVETITDSGVRIAPNLERMAENGAEISENAKIFSEKANQLADETGELLNKLQRVVGSGPQVGSVKVEGSLDVIRETRPNRYRTDLEARVSFSGNRIYAGLFDAFETNKITLQLGQNLNPETEVRYGIYASKPGLGVEYAVVRGLSLRGDFYDINNPRADLRARVELGGGFYGWLGANQVLKRNSLLVGVGFRR